MADVDELRPGSDRGEQRVEVVAQVGERHPVHDCALFCGVDHVAREGRPAAHDLVAGVENRLAQHVDAAVGAGADGDLGGADPVPAGERVVQLEGAAVGVAVQIAGGALERLTGSRERPERALRSRRA